jgi:hypothetical protein
MIGFTSLLYEFNTKSSFSLPPTTLLVNGEIIIMLNFYFAAVFMVNMGDFQVINEVYKEFFLKNFPARSAFQVRTFNPFSILLLALSVPALSAFSGEKVLTLLHFYL